MAFKRFELTNQQPINIYKRRTNRSLRLSVTAAGEVRVTIPLWASYGVGLAFAQARQDWIADQIRPVIALADGLHIGKAHRLRLYVVPGSTKVRSRISGTEVLISYPPTLDPTSPEVQAAIAAASLRALRKQAESLLPQRLATLATQHGFSYKSVSIKRLKSRWGSCDQHTHIVLNLFLMQLPWDCIDYVLLHELTHTTVLHHGPDFWAAMADVLPDVGRLRRAMRAYQPILSALGDEVVA
ncbi:MAG: YgjP-like metallopeptidase domain-containing protein [Candidatus Saccharibacteria bacterium]